MEIRHKLAGFCLTLLLILTWGIQAGATSPTPKKEPAASVQHGHVTKSRFETQETGVINTVDFQK